MGDKGPVLLDLRPPLRAHKNENRLYNKTGTHWNYLGAYYGYLGLMRRVPGLFPGFHFKRDFRFADAWKKGPAGENLKPFVAENFAEVLYIWKYYDEASMNYFNQEVLKRVLQEFKPDLVIDEVVERHLSFLFCPGAEG